VWFAELNAENEARRLLVLVDLSYEKSAEVEPVRLPHKKPKGEGLTVDQRQYNKALGALRAMAEKANADLKMRFARCAGSDSTPGGSVSSPAPVSRSSSTNTPGSHEPHQTHRSPY
jgi:hypothetical protein